MTDITTAQKYVSLVSKYGVKANLIDISWSDYKGVQAFDYYVTVLVGGETSSRNSSKAVALLSTSTYHDHDLAD